MQARGERKGLKDLMEIMIDSMMVAGRRLFVTDMEAGRQSIEDSL